MGKGMGSLAVLLLAERAHSRITQTTLLGKGRTDEFGRGMRWQTRQGLVLVLRATLSIEGG